ncbi:hypothetical protein HQ590_12145, partial [bacterium]|nr:hypothetical protein [bacterium]
MNVHGKPYRAVWMDGRDVVVIDQPLLPHRFALRRLRTHRQTATAIRTMVIRGAGTIGATAGYGLAQAFAEAAAKTRTPSVFRRYVQQAYRTLNETRPTAADLQHALDRVLAAAESSGEGEAPAEPRRTPRSQKGER